MIKIISRFGVYSLLALSCLVSFSTHDARADAISRHTRVLPGTCELVPNSGFASATFHQGSLQLNAGCPFPFDTVAVAVVTSTNSIGGLTNAPIPQGTLSFNATNLTPGVLNFWDAIGYYEAGPVLLSFSNILPAGTSNIVLNTVQPNKGQLLAVSFFWTADDNPNTGGAVGGGTCSVSGFKNNGAPLEGFVLVKPQVCTTYTTLP